MLCSHLLLLPLPRMGVTLLLVPLARTRVTLLVLLLLLFLVALVATAPLLLLAVHLCCCCLVIKASSTKGARKGEWRYQPHTHAVHSTSQLHSCSAEAFQSLAQC